MNNTFTVAQGLQNLFQVPSFIKLFVNTFFGFLVFNLAFMLMFGILKFIRKAEDEKERETGRKMIMWAIVGLFLMLSIWGIVRVLVNTVGLGKTAPPVPQVTTQAL